MFGNFSQTKNTNIVGGGTVPQGAKPIAQPKANVGAIARRHTLPGHVDQAPRNQKWKLGSNDRSNGKKISGFTLKWLDTLWKWRNLTRGSKDHPEIFVARGRYWSSTMTNPEIYIDRVNYEFDRMKKDERPPDPMKMEAAYIEETSVVNLDIPATNFTEVYYATVVWGMRDLEPVAPNKYYAKLKVALDEREQEPLESKFPIEIHEPESWELY